MKSLPYTGKYEVAVEKLVENNKFYIGDRDLADFVVKEYINKLYINKRVYISSTEDSEVQWLKIKINFKKYINI